MKRWIAVLSAAVLCLSLAVAVLSAAVLRLNLAVYGGKNDASVSSDTHANSVSSDTPANIVVDGKEISAKDFLIEHLSAYLQSEAYLARKAAFEETSAQEAQPFAVTDAFELKLDDWGSEQLSLHFFMVKANCDSFVDGIAYDSVTMAIDYDTGTVYDQYSVDESWMEKSEKEQAIYIAAAGGCFVNANYNGEPIFMDSETHIPLSDSDIAEINSVSSDTHANSVSRDTPANIVVDGKEIPVKDFLIEHLSAYIQSDEYLARTAKFEKSSGRTARPLAVTYAFELKSDSPGTVNQPLHFFMVKANCDSFVDGVCYDSVAMAIDYDTGTVYDQFSVDESWMEKSEKEQAIHTAVKGGYFADPFYNGEPIFMDSETHIPLSDSDIAEINQALSK